MAVPHFLGISEQFTKYQITDAGSAWHSGRIQDNPIFIENMLVACRTAPVFLYYNIITVPLWTIRRYLQTLKMVSKVTKYYVCKSQNKCAYQLENDLLSFPKLISSFILPNFKSMAMPMHPLFVGIVCLPTVQRGWK